MFAEFSSLVFPVHYDILMIFYDITTFLYLYALTDNDASERLFPLELYELLNSPYCERDLISMFVYLIEVHIVSLFNNHVTSKVCTVYDVAKIAPSSYSFEAQ